MSTATGGHTAASGILGDIATLTSRLAALEAATALEAEKAGRARIAAAKERAADGELDVVQLSADVVDLTERLAVAKRRLSAAKSAAGHDNAAVQHDRAGERLAANARAIKAALDAAATVQANLRQLCGDGLDVELGGGAPQPAPTSHSAVVSAAATAESAVADAHGPAEAARSDDDGDDGGGGAPQQQSRSQQASPSAADAASPQLTEAADGGSDADEDDDGGAPAAAAATPALGAKAGGDDSDGAAPPQPSLGNDDRGRDADVAGGATAATMAARVTYASADADVVALPPPAVDADDDGDAPFGDTDGDGDTVPSSPQVAPLDPSHVRVRYAGAVKASGGPVGGAEQHARGTAPGSDAAAVSTGAAAPPLDAARAGKVAGRTAEGAAPPPPPVAIVDIASDDGRRECPACGKKCAVNAVSLTLRRHYVVRLGGKSVRCDQKEPCCAVCDSDSTSPSNVLLRCAGFDDRFCPYAIHVPCMNTPLAVVPGPVDPWSCPGCAVLAARRGATLEGGDDDEASVISVLSSRASSPPAPAAPAAARATAAANTAAAASAVGAAPAASAASRGSTRKRGRGSSPDDDAVGADGGGLNAVGSPLTGTAAGALRTAARGVGVARASRGRGGGSASSNAAAAIRAAIGHAVPAGGGGGSRAAATRTRGGGAKRPRRANSDGGGGTSNQVGRTATTAAGSAGGGGAIAPDVEAAAEAKAEADQVETIADAPAASVDIGRVYKVQIRAIMTALRVVWDAEETAALSEAQLQARLALAEPSMRVPLPLLAMLLAHLESEDVLMVNDGDIFRV